MGDRPARSGDDNPDSPLVFSVPTSLQEYMSRYVDRPGERAPPSPPAASGSPEPFPVQHWFDNRRTSINTAVTQPAPSSTPLRATATAYEYNATAAAPPAASATPRNANPAAGETETSMHSDYIAAWRAMSGPPLLEPVDSELDGEGQITPPRRRFQAAHGTDYGTESDGGGVGRRRVQARSGSRGGRPQSSTDARRSGGGLGHGGTGGGSGSGGWSGESGGRVAEVPFSPMSAGGRDHGSGGGGGSSVQSDEPRHWHNAYAGNARNVPAWFYRRPPPGHRAHETVDERPRVVEGNTTSRGGSAQRGRRSLSDFLREIEEMVRAQREQQHRDQGNLPTRPQASSQPYDGPRSRPLAAAAAAMSSLPAQEHPMSGSDGDHPHVGGNARYVPPGERRWPTMTSHISRAFTDSRYMANTAAGRAEADPYNHYPAVGRRQEEGGAPFSRSAAAHTGGAGGSLQPSDPRSYPSFYVIPRLATTAAAAAGAMAGAESRPEVAGVAAGLALQERLPSTVGRAALHPPMRLSAAATAFSMPAGGVVSSTDQQRETSTAGDLGPNAAEEDRARRQRWSAVQERAREAERRRGPAIGRDGLAIGREGRAGGGIFAAMAAARARGDQTVPTRNPDGSWAFTQAERLAQAGLGFAHGGRVQHGDRGPYVEVVPLTRMAELPPERGTAAPADGGAAPAAGGGDGDGVGAGARTADDQSQSQSQSQSHLAALPAFRHWESQRARLRIQWHDPNVSPEPAVTESPASDGTMVLTDHLTSSNGPSPRGFGRGGGDEEVSKVEEALFSCLVSLGVRRLLLEKGRGSASARARNRRTPAWLEEWLDGGARPERIECSSAGPSGYENRCPRVGDVWELLELLLGWWAERVCAIAAGFPMWSGEAAAVEAEAAPGGAGSGGVGATGQQHQRRRPGGAGGRQQGSGMGSLAGDVAATTRAVESVQGLRKLGGFLMPLSRVRDFIGVDGGPTPRDAVLLKSLLVVHEGIAWAADRPHYRHYREEVIPTALKLYASLPQDVLEGVDLEVGHTLPESVFVITGAARPSWPRWGGSPSAVATTPSIEGSRGNGPGSGAGSHGTGHGGGGSGGMGSRGGRFIPGGYFNGSGSGSRRSSGGSVGGMRCAGGWEGAGGRRGGMFMPGPWVVFRVAREEYLEFYRDQAAALDQAIGGSTVELEHLLM